jgi:hypothetical protein
VVNNSIYFYVELDLVINNTIFEMVGTRVNMNIESFIFPWCQLVLCV